MVKPKVFFLCTANRCRTQMAEAFLRGLAGDPEICPDAVAVMPDFPWRNLAAHMAG